LKEFRVSFVFEEIYFEEGFERVGGE